MIRFCYTGATFDSQMMQMDSGGANLCTFDTTLTTFDGVRTFDQTTCDGETPTPTPSTLVVTGGGGGRKRRYRRYPGLRPAKSEIVVMGRPKRLQKIEAMSMQEIDEEIATLLKMKIRTQDDETSLVLLLALVS